MAIDKYKAPDTWNPQSFDSEDQKFYFGKNKGKTLAECDASYILFMQEAGWITLAPNLYDEIEMRKIEEDEEKEDRPRRPDRLPSDRHRKVDDSRQRKFSDHDDSFDQDIPF